MKVLVAYLLVTLVMSLVGFVMYGFDKRRSRTGGRRVSEKSLHIVALLGGWPGAWAGQQLFRHKTQKLSFRIVFWLVILVHLGVVGGVAYLWMSHPQA